jgi:exopolyphosphatase/guanosine-5'-triphosphate,3'-diphosphate pyrophosphatase
VAPHDDDQTIAALLGRDPSGGFVVVVRGRDGAPLVIENEPFLRDGTPMPTRYWLVDPGLRAQVGRLESAGGVREAERQVDPVALAESHRHYAAERDSLIPPERTGPRPSGGVGGTRQGVKCLHAHVAWWLAGGDDPVGRWTAERLDIHTADFVVQASGMDEPADPVAAVDCGTNSTRLIVVGAGGTTLARKMRITRLGEQVDATHRLRPVAIERTLSVLREYRGILEDLGVGRVRVVATSAARDAANADDFMSPAAAIMGARPEILTGAEEARLSFAGATAHLPPDVGDSANVLVVDIGGGSTELAMGAPRSQDVRTLSLDIGCVRVSERFLHDPVQGDEVARARAAVMEEVEAARSAFPTPPTDRLMIGLAGTVSTLASLQLGLAEYDRARIHHAVLTRADVDRWLLVLSSEDAAARLTRPGMDPGREDVIVGGVLILSVVMAAFGCDRCLVSEDDILDGLAASLLPPEAGAPTTP